MGDYEGIEKLAAGLIKAENRRKFLHRNPAAAAVERSTFSMLPGNIRRQLVTVINEEANKYLTTTHRIPKEGLRSIRLHGILGAPGQFVHYKDTPKYQRYQRQKLTGRVRSLGSINAAGAPSAVARAAGAPSAVAGVAASAEAKTLGKGMSLGKKLGIGGAIAAPALAALAYKLYKNKN